MDHAVSWHHEASDGAARTGLLHTPHGRVATPCFMPVATLGGLKGVTARAARAAGCGMVLTNTYHLALRPGAAVVQALGGVHGLAAWDGPMLTDSGGFQVFSLASRRRLDEEGVEFSDPRDGRRFQLSPESSIAIQRQLGADVIMAFDECPPGDAAPEVLAAAVERTGRWLTRSVAAWRAEDGPGGARKQALFGIVQGGPDPVLRRRSLELTLVHDLPGIALGGLAVGESAAERLGVLEALGPLLPPDRPHYLMGVGTPLDLVEAISRGLDLFDCVLPTRMGRHGIAYTDQGPLHAKRAEWSDSTEPIDAATLSEASAYPRGAIRHLLKTGEILGGILLSLHNLAYYQLLMARCRAHILAGSFARFADDYRRSYRDEAHP